MIDAGYHYEEIAAAVNEHLRNGRCRKSPLYGDGLAGPRIAQHLAEFDLRVEKKLAY